MISVNIQGHEIFETIRMPEIPRKGDLLWLNSLTSGRCPVTEVIVSRVEWARDQTARIHDTENEGIHVWLTVRRTNGRGKPVEEGPE